MKKREVAWCNTHDIPWASHADLGVVLDGCERGKRFMVEMVEMDETTEITDAIQVNPFAGSVEAMAVEAGAKPIPKPVPQLSTSGHWAQGQTYVPDTGECAGHVVSVVNPRVQAMRQVTFERNDEKRTLTGLIECVQVRCTQCFRSWRFPAAAELLGVDEVPSKEYQVALARSIFDEIVGNGGLDELA